MLAYMNEESLKRTLEARGLVLEPQPPGAVAQGRHVRKYHQGLRGLADCDADTILLRGRPAGPVCHTGNRTCFFQQLKP
jgi:phosphoribosyl-AMP cyclohydrolase